MFGQTRSKEMIVAAAMSLMLLLSACSSSAPANNGATASPTPVQTGQTQAAASPEASPEEAKRTKVIQTVMGDVEIPTDPQRVVVQYLMGDLVALDVTPVGVSVVNEGAAYENEVKEATVVGQWEFEPEDIMALNPDLIILASDTQYDDMSKIAPTVIVPYGTMKTEERLTFLGEVLSRPEQAQAAYNEYQTALSEGKAKLAAAGLDNISVSGMMVTDGGIWVAGSKHALGSVLYDELKLKAPEAVQTTIIDAGEFWGTPSMEVLADFCGDYVFHLGEMQDAIVDNAVWQSIPTVINGNVLTMNTALTYYTDITSAIAMVNDIVEQIAGTP